MTTRVTWLYMDNKEGERVTVGKIGIDDNEDAWVTMDKDVLAAELEVEDIDGMALLSHENFDQGAIHG